MYIVTTWKRGGYMLVDSKGYAARDSRGRIRTFSAKSSALKAAEKLNNKGK